MVVKVLLQKQADLNTKDHTYSRSALAWAVEIGYSEVVQLLLENGANRDSRDNVGRTPLSLAAEKGYTTIVTLLLEKGTDSSCKDNNGRTPLSFAVENGHEAITNLLLEKGADPNSRNNFGQHYCRGPWTRDMRLSQSFCLRKEQT